MRTIELQGALRQRERVAWLVLLSSSGLFAILVALGGLLAWRLYHTATVDQEARLLPVAGTVLVHGPRDPGWSGAMVEMKVSPGTRIRTDATSQAFLRFSEGSTLRLYAGSEVELQVLRRGRFVAHGDELTLRVHQGQVEIGIAPEILEERRFTILGPQGPIALVEGAYTLSVDNGVLYLKVRALGLATIRSGPQGLTVLPNQRIEIPPQGPLLPPVAAREELLFNGRFDQGLLGWQWDNEIGFQEGRDTLGEVRLVMETERPVVQFLRRASLGGHAETYLAQTLDRQVSSFATLVLQARFRVDYQSLSGGGYLGSEYPLFVRISYRAEDGDYFRVFGFYYENEGRNRTDNGNLVQRKEWQTMREDLLTWSPRPVSIAAVQISASGWDYESYLAEVSLSGQ